MNIEDLSKTQLLLLAILVNFVTAIATSVMTVSLLDQAPPTVTQTVNRIVERTVESAAQTPIPGIAPAKETVVIKSEDLMTAAIRADASRTIRLYKGATTTPALAVGAYLPKAKAVVVATVPGLPKEALVAFADGSTAQASLSKADNALTIYGFADAQTLPKVAVPDLLAASTLQPGQTVIGIASDGSAVTGIISKVDADAVRATVTGIPAGAAAVSISGDLIGIAGATAGTFIPSDKILTLLVSAPAS